VTSRAMILAAGLGTRLRPLTEELPKALLPLGDRPVLAHVASALQRHGISSAVVNAHHLHQHLSAFAASYPFLAQVVSEPEIRGTAGGVAGARAFLSDGPLLVVNADLVFDYPVAALFERAARDGFSMAVRKRPAGEGRVGLDAAGNVVRLRDERFAEESFGGDYLSVCALADEARRALPEQGCLVADFALPRLRRGESIGTVEVSGDYLSIGDSLSDYLAANQRWLDGREHYVAEGAVVAPGVRLEHSVVGAGATVLGHGLLSGCVVWPGARVSAPLSNAVITTRQKVVA
jgi:mannose-1-phosphate guanylyltransferase